MSRSTTCEGGNEIVLGRTNCFSRINLRTERGSRCTYNIVIGFMIYSILSICKHHALLHNSKIWHCQNAPYQQGTFVFQIRIEFSDRSKVQGQIRSCSLTWILIAARSASSTFLSTFSFFSMAESTYSSNLLRRAPLLVNSGSFFDDDWKWTQLQNRLQFPEPIHTCMDRAVDQEDISNEELFISININFYYLFILLGLLHVGKFHFFPRFNRFIIDLQNQKWLLAISFLFSVSTFSREFPVDRKTEKCTPSKYSFFLLATTPFCSRHFHPLSLSPLSTFPLLWQSYL